MKKYASTLRDAVLLLGCALIALGTAMIYIPAGLIAAGALLAALAVVDGFDENGEEGSDNQT